LHIDEPRLQLHFSMLLTVKPCISSILESMDRKVVEMSRMGGDETA